MNLHYILLIICLLFLLSLCLGIAKKELNNQKKDNSDARSESKSIMLDKKSKKWTKDSMKLMKHFQN